ncbi:hypothetical protein [Nonomuraea sp. NPDC050310]|uniref:hypothetical protein n=1 Tax=Nonomuraea sp. NPDC050310 TaxID=3154935 RepID=UPI0033E4991D
MLMPALGVAWLVLAPLALWFLVRGRALAKVAAVLTLGLLEAATIALPSPPTAPVVLAVRPAPAPPAACAERFPAPLRGQVGHEHLTLSWPAAAGECARAEVLVRQKGHRLRVWVHEGGARHEQATVVPVSVSEGVASLRVPVEPGGRGRFLAVDSHTGERIPVDRTH